MRMHETVNLNM